MRRALALFLMLSTLHVFVASAALRCATAASARPSAGATADMPDMPGMPGMSHQTTPAGRHDRAPTPLPCCDALSSCAISMIAAIARADDVPRAIREVGPATEDDFARSHGDAPEPPPPRV